jgi:3-hydroxybutyryl-CoA dehydrogenase
MVIQICCDDAQWAEITSSVSSGMFNRVDRPNMFDDKADAYMQLSDELPASFHGNKPFFINAVIQTLQEIHASDNVLRINAWPGFLQQPRWEFAGTISASAERVFAALGKIAVPVADRPGLVTARVIAMVINEAYYALGEQISSKAEIDTAMKYGTNYPFGPFEWAEKIALRRVYELLNRLSLGQKRYVPAELLVKEALHESDSSH